MISFPLNSAPTFSVAWFIQKQIDKHYLHSYVHVHLPLVMAQLAYKGAN